ncbi:transcriptional regulator, DeoR family [Pilibacter termitis]|uniref:Transcriptional regulator, DeoR family n=1 Tax=Pilibacter termitis TaxID=263852 RepID=A0A1T4KVL8_9ENTE|nr:DeoR/GlpR family DNA-binding transcription regulator [Pilibacter termitis]SJZ46357.1 transcriptional regulator, DeoR family [Pilibacter termitis]
MKNSIKNVIERQSLLYQALQENNELTVAELSKYLKCSEVTIRRDLSKLEKMGKIFRKRGKAACIPETPINENKNEEIQRIKENIASVTAKLIPEGSTIFVNSSSIAMETVKKLADKRLTILTNNVRIIDSEQHPETTILLSGGEVRFPREILVGEFAASFFHNMIADFSIIGSYGVTYTAGLTTPLLNEAEINRIMIQNTSGPIILVADYRKIGLITNFKTASIKSINYLITDIYANQEIIRQIEAQGVQVIQVNPY